VILVSDPWVSDGLETVHGAVQGVDGYRTLAWFTRFWVRASEDPDFHIVGMGGEDGHHDEAVEPHQYRDVGERSEGGRSPDHQVTI